MDFKVFIYATFFRTHNHLIPSQPLGSFYLLYCFLLLAYFFPWKLPTTCLSLKLYNRTLLERWFTTQQISTCLSYLEHIILLQKIFTFRRLWPITSTDFLIPEHRLVSYTASTTVCSSHFPLSCWANPSSIASTTNSSLRINNP